MENKVVYLLDAKNEFDEAIDFYEERLEGLGERFEKHVREKIELIIKFPERYPVRKNISRVTIVSGFPYIIVYKYFKVIKTIVILSIFHTSRNPKLKYRR